MARTYPEKKEAAMSHISHHAAAGENPASRKPPVEETPGRKIVKGLFCAGVALSAALFSGPVWSDDVFIGPSNGNIKIDKKIEGNVLAGGYETDETVVSGNTITIESGAEITTNEEGHGGRVYGGRNKGDVTDNLQQQRSRHGK